MDANEFVTYFRVIRKRLWLILLLMVVTIGIIVAMVATEPPVYRATVRLQVVASDPLFSPTGTKTSAEELIAARNEFASALSSAQVAWKTIGELELGIDALELLNHISVVKEDVFVTVNVEAAMPETAFRIAEAHVNNALAYYRNERARPARAFRDFLAAQLKEESQLLSKANSELLDFRVKNSSLRPDNEALAYQTLIRELQSERDHAEIEAVKSEAVAKDFVAKAQDAALKADQAQARQATATAGYYTALAQKYAGQVLDHEAVAIAARAAMARYDQLIAQKKAELLDYIRLGDQYNALDTAVRREESNYAFLLSKENEARLRESQAKSVGFIDILEPARYPDKQAASKLPRLVLIGGIVSLLTGVILAFLLEFFESLGQPSPAGAREF